MAQEGAGLRRRPDPNLLRSGGMQVRKARIPAPSAELFAELVARMADGVALHNSIRDDSGRIVDFRVDYANDSLSRLTGLAHDDLVGHTILELFPGRRTNGVFDAYVRVVESGESLVREDVPGRGGLAERSGDGDGTDAAGGSALRTDPDGFGPDYDILVSKLGDGYVVLMRDVAGRRRAEQELFQSQNMLRAVLDTIPQRVFWKDRNSTFLGCNAPYARDAGLSDPSELIGKNDDDMTWRAESERYRSDDRHVMETGEPKLMFEEPQPRPDGTLGWIRTSKVPQRDHTGQIVGVLGTYEDITDQKRAEEALFESQEMLRLILDSVPQRVFWKDREGKFLGANAAFIRDLGLTDPKEIAGKTDFDLGREDAAAMYRADDERVMKTGRAALTYEERSIRPDGHDGWLRTSKLPLRDRSGAVVGVLGTFEDITESKRAEEALRKSQQLLDSIVENIPDMVFVKDARDLSYVLVNRAEERMLGYSKEEILRGDDRGQSTPAEKEFFEAIDRQVLETGELVDIPEERLTTMHGVRILHTTKIPIMNDEGRPRYLLGIAEDITERKSAERARLESETRYRRMIDSITDYVVSVKIEHGVAVSVSHATGSVAVIGYTPEELRDDPGLWVSRVVPEDRYLVEDAMRRVLLGERIGQIEHRIRRKDGTVRWVRHTPVLTFDDHGEAIAYDGLIQDVTETHILQDQLNQAQKMESIGRLAGGIAHDFNNLLTAILGYVEMCRLDLPNIPADHPARADLQEIATAGERAASLTRQLLTFASRQMVQTVRLDLNSHVADSLKMLERLLGEEVEIEAVLNPKAGTIEADPVQISQLLVNLAVNAKDAMPRGGKLLIETGSETLDDEAAQAHPGAHAGPHVVLAVTDTGVGMTPEVQSHLFEPFFTTKERGKGTGLGLATCHGIVRQMDGHIRVYSEVDRGTSFRIYLPGKNGPADLVAAAQLNAPAPTGTETILVVEDEPGIRRLGVIGLRARGYVVLEAANGAEAVEIALRVGADIDMVVSDVVMPGMSGPELLEQLSTIVPHARALLVSGHAESAILSPASSLRYAFLAKPFTPERLARMVRDVLDGAPA